MYPFDRSLDAGIGSAWLAGLFAAAFLVTWLTTDVARVPRTPYVAILAAATAGITTGYLAWTGAGASFWTKNWGWAIVGAVLTGAVMLAMVRRLPKGSRPVRLMRLIGWEGIVYGAAEALLLSVLPVAVVWQLWRSMEWSSFVTGGAVAVLASLGLIVVHHLGYWEFRGPLMRYAIIGCGVLTIAYVVTINPIVPIVGHIVLHAAMVRKGVELPPHPHPKDVTRSPTTQPRLRVLTAR